MYFVVTVRLLLVEYRNENKIFKKSKFFHRHSYEIRVSHGVVSYIEEHFLASHRRKLARSSVRARTIRKRTVARRIVRDRHFAQPAFPKFNFTPGSGGGSLNWTSFDVIAPRASSLPPIHVLWLLVEHVCGPSLARSLRAPKRALLSSRRP